MSNESNNTLVSAMQDILTAPDANGLKQAMEHLNAVLATKPVNMVLAQSGQLTDLAEQYLTDAIESNMDLILPHTLRACKAALDDWQFLRRPMLPAPVLTPTARSILNDVSEYHAAAQYDEDRKSLWEKLQSLEEGEQEAVSGIVSKKLAELLIRAILPELYRQKGDTTMRRQFMLWSQLQSCREHGLDNLAVYFLQADGDRIRVLLPSAMDFHSDAKLYYGCAKTFSVLYHQLPVCQRDELFRRLLRAVENETVDGVLRDETMDGFDAIRDLYLAMLAEEHTRLQHFWETPCYAKHTVYHAKQRGTLNQLNEE